MVVGEFSAENFIFCFMLADPGTAIQEELRGKIWRYTSSLTQFLSIPNRLSLVH
jgi:hypothetical protein